jgi:hypothetical protein
MTAKESVFELLKRDQDDAQGARSSRDAKIREWRSALEDLFRSIRSWLTDAERQKLLRIQEPAYDLQEARYGEYPAPGLKIISPTGVTIDIVPVGLNIVGAQGRVDVVCNPKKRVLILKEPGKWYFATLAAKGWDLKEFNEESFWETIKEFLS